MRVGIVKVIAKKELLESFRDRKTLFLMIFLPILLYPVLILVVTQVVLLQQSKLAEQKSTVVVTHGGDGHPFVEYLRQDDRFEIVEDTGEGTGAEPDDDGAQALLDLSGWPAEADESVLHARIGFESVEDASRQAKDRLEEALGAYSERERRARLERRGLDPQAFAPVFEPVKWRLTDESPPAQRGGYALGSFLPILVMATVLLGAFYPAIDLTAGEKERGSIQTLFTAPVTPLEIVAGKYVAVLVIALVSGMANLVGMLLLFSQNLFMAGEALDQVDFSIGPDAALALFVVIVLIAAFFSALLLTVAVLARSYKEGQNYVTPVYMASFLPAVVTQLPGFELTPQLALVPAVNVTLLMKEVLVYGVKLESLFLVAVSTLVFTSLVLVLAGKLFAQEAVVLGERGNLRLLDRRRPDEPDRRPRLGEGLAWYGVSFVALFYLGSWAQSKDLFGGLIFTLWGILLLPTLLLARYLRLDFRATFNLRRPAARPLAAAVLLGLSAWVLVGWLNHFLDEYVMHMPRELAEQMGALLPSDNGVWTWVVLVFAVSLSPAICEEALFRGYLFSSLRGRVAPWALVVVTAVLFGAFHLSVYRLFGTTALGLVMGLLVWKSGSIWTSAVFHGLSNLTAVLAAVFLGGAFAEEGAMPPWLVVSGAVGFALGLALLLGVRSPWRAAPASGGDG